MALDAQHPRAVVELVGHNLADALEGAAAGTGGALGLVADPSVRQVRGQRLALVLLLLPCADGTVASSSNSHSIAADGLFQQALLLGIDGVRPGCEPQPLEHGHLVCEFVDGGSLECHLVVATCNLKLVGCGPSSEREDQLALLLRVQVVKVGRVDRGRYGAPTSSRASAHSAIALQHADHLSFADPLPRQTEHQRIELGMGQAEGGAAILGPDDFPWCRHRADSQIPMPSCTRNFMRLANARCGRAAPKTRTTGVIAHPESRQDGDLHGGAPSGAGQRVPGGMLVRLVGSVRYSLIVNTTER